MSIQHNTNIQVFFILKSNPRTLEIIFTWLILYIKCKNNMPYKYAIQIDNNLIVLLSHKGLTLPLESHFKGPYQCDYMPLSFVNIAHIGYINPVHFPQSSFFYEILRLFTFCSFSINVIERTYKFVTLGKKNVCVKIILHANIRARKAALVRNYFFLVY